MTVLLGVVLPLITIVFLPCSHAMATTSEHSGRSHKPITRRESQGSSTQRLSPESTWPFKPENIGVTEAGDLVPVGRKKGGESLMQQEPPQEVNPINDGMNSSAYCGLDFVLGMSNTTNCSNMADHFLMEDPADCIEAASQAGATANNTRFYIESDYFQKRPKGCFAYPCSEDPNGVCYYYNGVGFWPDITLPDFMGRPVCSRQRWLNGTKTAGSRNPNANPGGCSPGYANILSNETCLEMASCKSYCVGYQFRVDVLNYSKHDEYPQGCFIHDADGCVYFNPPDENLPQTPRGLPVCNVSSFLHFPEAGGVFS
mmetsp:Transcript_28130/g.49034  ORF Transcript_28130/g.49034 Transcript_28130/m.49034 type:complete len:314 (+) Transcript_28130:108-1049(+)